MTVSETLVNTLTASDQVRSDAASFSNGSYVVVWQSTDVNQGREAFASSASRPTARGLAPRRVANTASAFNESYARVAVLDNDNFVITWTAFGQDGSGEGIYAQLFNSSGVAIGSEIQVNATTGGRQTQSAVAAQQGGTFVITWASDNGPGDGSGYGSYAQRFDASGQFVNWNGSSSGNTRAEQLLNTSTSGDQGWTNAIGLSDGRLLALYGSGDGSYMGPHIKIFNTDGTVAAGELRVNTYTDNYQVWPQAVQLASGDIVVSWISAYQDGSGYGTYARILTSGGVPKTGEFSSTRPRPATRPGMTRALARGWPRFPTAGLWLAGTQTRATGLAPASMCSVLTRKATRSAGNSRPISASEVIRPLRRWSKRRLASRCFSTAKARPAIPPDTESSAVRSRSNP